MPSARSKPDRDPQRQKETLEAAARFGGSFFSPWDDPLSRELAAAAGVPPERFVDWRWQLSHQLRTEAALDGALTLTASEREGVRAGKELFRVGVTPYYAYLAAQKGGEPLRRQAIPLAAELADDWGIKDPLDEKLHSPVPEVVHLYPDRVAFCVAMLCPVYCRYCYRKRRDGEDGLHFNRTIIDRGIEYIAGTPAIRDVLITGGDPLLAHDSAILGLVERLRRIPHVEIIRIGTRTPVTLPYRVTPELARGLAAFHPVWVNTHFNCAEELTAPARAALAHLVDAGIPVGNQAVLLRGINDSAERMANLCRSLLRARVRPYYVFHPHRVAGTHHLRVSVQRGLEIMRSLRGKVSGMGIPTYCVDTPSGKVPIGHNHVLGRDGDDLLLEDLEGAIWREKGAFADGAAGPLVREAPLG